MFNNVDYDSSPLPQQLRLPPPLGLVVDRSARPTSRRRCTPSRNELKLFEINLKTARAITNYETLRTGSSNADLNAFNARMNAIATALSACMAESILPQGARPIVQLHDSDDLTALRRVANVESPKEFPVVTFSEACMLLASL